MRKGRARITRVGIFEWFWRTFQSTPRNPFPRLSSMIFTVKHFSVLVFAQISFIMGQKKEQNELRIWIQKWNQIRIWSAGWPFEANFHFGFIEAAMHCGIRGYLYNFKFQIFWLWPKFKVSELLSMVKGSKVSIYM